MTGCGVSPILRLEVCRRPLPPHAARAHSVTAYLAPPRAGLFLGRLDAGAVGREDVVALLMVIEGQPYWPRLFASFPSCSGQLIWRGLFFCARPIPLTASWAKMPRFRGTILFIPRRWLCPPAPGGSPTRPGRAAITPSRRAAFCCQSEYRHAHCAAVGTHTAQLAVLDSTPTGVGPKAHQRLTTGRQ